jgi:hypothetical protein
LGVSSGAMIVPDDPNGNAHSEMTELVGNGSIVAFFITFREALEGFLILTVMFRFLDKSLLPEYPTLHRKLRRHIILGGLAGNLFNLIPEQELLI